MEIETGVFLVALWKRINTYTIVTFAWRLLPGRFKFNRIVRYHQMVTLSYWQAWQNLIQLFHWASKFHLPDWGHWIGWLHRNWCWKWRWNFSVYSSNFWGEKRKTAQLSLIPYCFNILALFPYSALLSFSLFHLSNSRMSTGANEHPRSNQLYSTLLPKRHLLQTSSKDNLPSFGCCCAIVGLK